MPEKVCFVPGPSIFLRGRETPLQAGREGIVCPLDLLVGDPWGAESIEQCVVHRHPLTHSFSGYLLSIHDVPGTVLGARDTPGNKVPIFMRLIFYCEMDRK